MPGPHDLIADHSRHWRDFHYVYPVISRRSGGLSVGINLNVDGACNYDCVYCQVDLNDVRRGQAVDLERLCEELDTMLAGVTSGAFWQDAKFSNTPDAMRRLNDIAFSGDGEPTAHPLFAKACDVAIACRDRHGFADRPIVVITNATRLDQPEVIETIDRLSAAGGEVWAKLDAGREEDFQRIDRPRGSVTLRDVLDRIAAAGARHPLVIQTMLLREGERDPSDEQLTAYLDRLVELHQRGCAIKRIDLYTVARQTREADLHPLSDSALAKVAEQINERLPDLSVTHHGETED